MCENKNNDHFANFYLLHCFFLEQSRHWEYERDNQRNWTKTDLSQYWEDISVSGCAAEYEKTGEVG